MFEADCGASGTACVSARGAPSPWPATRVGRVAGVSHPHACATPRHHAPAVYESTTSHARGTASLGSLGMILLRYLRFAAARAERYTVSAMHILAGVFRVEH